MTELLQFLASDYGSVLGGSITGFLLTYMSSRAQAREEALNNAIKRDKADSENMDAASSRGGKGGNWIRRFMVICVCFTVFIVPFIAPLVGLPLEYIDKTSEKSILWGLISWGGETSIIDGKGVLLHAKEHIGFFKVFLSFYFGMSAGKRI